MIEATFYSLIRSKYKIDTMRVSAATLGEMIDAILAQRPDIDPQELLDSVIFVNEQRIVHLDKRQTPLADGDRVVFTHFVGGG